MIRRYKKYAHIVKNIINKNNIYLIIIAWPFKNLDCKLYKMDSKKSLFAKAVKFRD